MKKMGKKTNNINRDSILHWSQIRQISIPYEIWRRLTTRCTVRNFVFIISVLSVPSVLSVLLVLSVLSVSWLVSSVLLVFLVSSLSSHSVLARFLVGSLGSLGSLVLSILRFFPVHSFSLFSLVLFFSVLVLFLHSVYRFPVYIMRAFLQLTYPLLCFWVVFIWGELFIYC